MSHRITGTHLYTYDHDGGNGVKVSIIWGVPYSAVVRGVWPRIKVEEVELDGMAVPEHVSIHLCKSGPITMGGLEDREEFKQIWLNIVRSELTVAEIIGEITESIRERTEVCVG